MIIVSLFHVGICWNSTFPRAFPPCGDSWHQRVPIQFGEDASVGITLTEEMDESANHWNSFFVWTFKDEDVSRCLQGTCTSHNNSRFVMKVNRKIAVGNYTYYIDMNILDTISSDEGTYNLRSASGADCAIFTVHVQFDKYQPTCLTVVPNQRSTIRLVCSWVPQDKHESARLMGRNHLLKKYCASDVVAGSEAVSRIFNNSTTVSTTVLLDSNLVQNQSMRSTLGNQLLSENASGAVATCVASSKVLQDNSIITTEIPFDYTYKNIHVFPVTCIVFAAGFENNCQFSVFTLPKTHRIEEYGQTVVFTCCKSRNAPIMWWYNKNTTRTVLSSSNKSILLEIDEHDEDASTVFFICGNEIDNELRVYGIGKLVLSPTMSRNISNILLLVELYESNGLAKNSYPHCPYESNISVTATAPPLPEKPNNFFNPKLWIPVILLSVTCVIFLLSICLRKLCGKPRPIKQPYRGQLPDEDIPPTSCGKRGRN